ncbi:hypothetical protein PTKIN_Ptkin04bG0098400 [Pterospermum kingtungense]
MAKSKDDMKFATAQAKQSEDESLRVAYKHGTPLEGGKIAESSPVDLFSGAHHITSTSQSQSNRPAAAGPDETGKTPINADSNSNDNTTTTT